MLKYQEKKLHMRLNLSKQKQNKSPLTSKFVYADNEGLQISDPMVKYGLHPATWAEFAKCCQLIGRFVGVALYSIMDSDLYMLFFNICLCFLGYTEEGVGNSEIQ